MFNQARTSPWRLPRTLPCFVSTSSASVASFIVFLLHRGGEGYRVPGLRAGRIRGGEPRVAPPPRARASAPVRGDAAGVPLPPPPGAPPPAPPPPAVPGRQLQSE